MRGRAGPSRRFPPRVLVAAMVASLAAGSTAHAGDGRQAWRTLETEHFVVHYYEPNEDVGRRVAVVAERAHRVLSPALQHAPREKTHLVLNDTSDGANGFAMASPRNVIGLYMTAPSATSVLNDHDDWLFGLVVHEYAHVLHLDTTSGLPEAYNRVYGKIWLPNQVQPRWFIEGLATYEESKRTSGGRTRSAIFDMYLRMAVLAGKHLGLDVMSSGYRPFPHGNIAYLYGSHFVKFIADRYGDETIARISHAYGQNPIPFDLGGAVAKATGKNYDQLFAEWSEHLRQKYELQKEAVLRRGLVEGRRLTRSGEGNDSPRYSPDGKEIAWHESDGKRAARYRAMPQGADSSRAHDVAVIDGASSFSFLPDGSGMVLERFGPYRGVYYFGDLYRYDFASRRLVRLTRGTRALVPDVSPDGQRIAFVVGGRSKMRLGILPLDAGRKPEIWWEGPGRFDQVFSPAWSPDGKKIAFTAWTTGGYRDVYVLDTGTKQTTRLMEDRAIDLSPCWSPDGKWLYFASDRSGIYNIYAIDPETRDLWQVTNVVGGTFDFDVSPDGKNMVYSGFHAEGYDLHEIEINPARWLRPVLYMDDRPDPIRIPDDEIRIDGPRPYRPLETLAPKTWSGSLTADSFGSAIALRTGGYDVLGHHGWSLGATVGEARGDVSLGASYSYNQFWPSFYLALGRSISRPFGLWVGGRNTTYTEEGIGALASVSFPVLSRPEVSSGISATYDFIVLRNLDGPPRPDPWKPIPVLPETGRAAGLALGWSLSSVRSHSLSLGPREGRSMGFGLRMSHPALGSEFEVLEFTYRWHEFFPMPWRKQVLSVGLSGGIETTSRRNDGDYYFGSLPQQDIVSAILNSTRVGSSGILHGYPSGIARGRKYSLLNAEYRIFLKDLDVGLSTLPAYVGRLHAALIFDAGHAWNEALDLADFRLAAGGALRLDTLFGFFAGGTLELGYARGLSDGGENQYWFLLTHGI
ncbi:MAG: PD40 domain-containing protein [Deltaproteobacteria bacterium]|nr:PD40 domain-containing protein [Deltaproteobacteria bacterium]